MNRTEIMNHTFINPFAVFAVVSLPGGEIAATTRASDRGEAGRIGLPGGKVDPGETPVEAVLREAAEEGWDIDGVDPTPIHSQLVEGKPVLWFRAHTATLRASYKEQGRIRPVTASPAQIAASGFGNDNLSL